MSLKCWIKLWGLSFWKVKLAACEYSWGWNFSVAFLMKDMGCFVAVGGAAESIDKQTSVIYSQGPERLTKMSGTKASCYFLTAVQTCIDRNLALQIKKWSSEWLTSNQIDTIVCFRCQFACLILQLLLKKHFPLQEALKLPCPLENISTWALTTNLAVTMGSIQHSNCLSRFAV